MSILCHKNVMDVKQGARSEGREASRLFPLASRSSLLAPLLLLTFCLSGCSLFSSEEPSAPPVAPAETQALLPTFTATSEVVAQPTQTSQPAQPAAVADTPTTSAAAATATLATQADTPTPLPTVVPTATPVPVLSNKPRLTISQASANVRNGPGTTYGIVGAVTQGQQFDLIGKNPTGDWWKICCVNGEQGWVFGPLVTVENGELVAVEQNIAPPPVAIVQPTQPPAPPTQPPAPPPTQPPPTQPPPVQPPPTQPPAPPPTQPPAPVAQAGPDPCANIGGDGCKFKLKSGPSFGAESGQIKLQLFFIHSGVDGGQPQGSYFVSMFKDGQKLPISDGKRSLALDKFQGSLGPYNYEYSMSVDQIPGGSVGGTYTIYVVDGNGERDSKDFVINIPDGQGLVYIVFDQA